jgi:nucleoside-triphosphatase
MGARGVGKSTVIRGLTDRLAARGVEIGGFKTVAGPVSPLGRDAVYLLPYRERADDPAALSEACIVATRDRRAMRYESYAAVFDARGAELLRRAPRCGLIVMDELGFMEAEAHVFQEAVLSLLDGETPVLGVVKPPDAPAKVAFLEAVRGRRNMRLFTLTRENREEMPGLLYPLLEAALGL